MNLEKIKIEKISKNITLIKLDNQATITLSDLSTSNLIFYKDDNMKLDFRYSYESISIMGKYYNNNIAYLREKDIFSFLDKDKNILISNKNSDFEISFSDNSGFLFKNEIKLVRKEKYNIDAIVEKCLIEQGLNYD